MEQSAESHAFEQHPPSFKENEGVFEKLVDFARELVAHFPGWESVLSTSDHTKLAAELTHAAQQALHASPDNCSRSVSEVAHHFGIQELDGRNANSQVSFMHENWNQVTPGEALGLANSGKFVVAGWANPVAGGHGHTAVVTPGPGGFHNGAFSPNVTGGGAGMGQGNGRTTAIDVFTAHREFHYYTPRY